MMKTTGPLREAVSSGGEVRVPLPAVLMLLAFAGSCTQAAGQAQAIVPQVQVQSVHELAEENPMVPWKPGDPVRVVPDLHESEKSPTDKEGEIAQIEMQPPRPLKPTVGQPVREGEESFANTEEGQKAQIEMQPPRPLKPIVRQPVAPQVMDENLKRLPTPKRYEEGDPVRIVPDLKESDTEN